MTYVYRDPGRLRGRPVHTQEDVPEPPRMATPPPAEPPPEPKPAKPYVLPPKKKPRPLPPPLWGGTLGLDLATAESADLDRRTLLLVESGANTEWVREFKRIRNIH
jgi:hypothetical protein